MRIPNGILFTCTFTVFPESNFCDIIVIRKKYDCNDEGYCYKR